MERLQTALEKARTSRTAPAGAGMARPTPGHARQPDQAAAQAAWEALPELDLPARVDRKSRLSINGDEVQRAPFDMLRTRLLQQAQPQGWRRIAIVSAGPGAGKTMVTASLALSLSRHDELRTMVLDLDLRRPNLASTLGATPPPGGMEEILRGEKDFAEHGRRLGENLAFGFTKAASRGSAELLQSRRASETLAMIEDRYKPDFMLFDLPPVMGPADSLAFLRNVDAALFVAEAEKTPIRQIDLLERQIADLTNVLGIVLNKCRYQDALYGTNNGYY